VAFWILVAGFLVAIVLPVLPDLLLPVCFVASFVAAFAIGVRFPSPWWTAGPPVAILAAVLVALAVPESGPATPTAMGNMTQKDQFEFVLMFGGWIFLILLALVYAGLAWAGVRVGRRREVAGPD
jgi:hypothetical protein